MAIPSRQIGWSQESNLIYELLKLINKTNQVMGTYFSVGSSLPIQINEQSTSYTLQLSDNAKLINITDNNPNTLTVPSNATVNFPIGTQIFIAEYGTGQVTIAPELGVTLRSANGKLKLAAQYSGASIVKIDTNEWYVFGDLSL